MSQSAQHDLAFLHTAQSHVARFDMLLAGLAPDLRVRHVVQEELLTHAQTLGNTNASLIEEVSAAMRLAASSGAGVVVCTCSSIGGIAEALNTSMPFTCQRIDRAMADTAVQTGSRILVVLALASSKEPTLELLQQSANALKTFITPCSLEVPDAWAHFLADDMPNYDKSIALAVRAHPQNYDVVVLAQASMQAAAQHLKDLGKPVLCSPAIGILKALDQLEHSLKKQ